MNWKVWAQGLSAAALGGAAGGTAQYTQASGGKVNSGTLVCAGVGALFTAVAYILRSPLQPAQPGDPQALKQAVDPRAERTK